MVLRKAQRITGPLSFVTSRFNRVTCVSISALVVDVHCVLAQQELHHLQVFSIGARTVEEIQHHL